MPMEPGAFAQLVAKLEGEFATDPARLPEAARHDWSAAELRMWFASGGELEPPENAQLRRAACKMSERSDLRTAHELQEDCDATLTRVAAMQAPWWDKVSAAELAKATMYREAAVARGHSARPHGLFAAGDEYLAELRESRRVFAFEKHVLFWDGAPPILPAKQSLPEGHPDHVRRAALHADEGFTHSDSACEGRGLDMRYFWDAASLRVVAAARYSMKAVGAWSAIDDDTSGPWGTSLVHGAVVEAVMDELMQV